MNHRYRRLLTPILLLALLLGSATTTALLAEKQADPSTSISSTKDPTSHEKVSKEKLRRYVSKFLLGKRSSDEDRKKLISQDELRRHLTKLASDEFQGRNAAGEGGILAARYIAGEFKKLGLKPAGDNGGYFQPFMASQWRGVSYKLELAPPRETVEEMAEETGEETGEETAEEMAEETAEEAAKSTSTSSAPLSSTASGCSTRQENSEESEDSVTESDDKNTPWQDTEADRVRRTWAMWENHKVYYLGSYFAYWCHKNYAASLGKYKDFECRNVVALLPGTDPKLKDEVIVLSAHYDHMGIWRGDVYNGADDNASGTTTILELARVLKKQGTRRSILFIAFDAEEKGLWGSRNWVKHPTIPLEKIMTQINLDMVGRMRNDQVYVLGADCSDPLAAIITEEAYDAEITIEELGSYPRGDHWAFFRERIPSVMFFNGLHEDYHLPTDDIEKIDFDAMEKLVGMILEVVKELDARDKKVPFTVKAVSEEIVEQSKVSPLKSLLECLLEKSP